MKMKGKSEHKYSYFSCSAGRLTWHEEFIPASEGGFQGYSRSMAFYHILKATVPIKMHLMEDHEGKYSTYYAGFSLLGEQGGELIHAKFNRLGLVFAPICCAQLKKNTY